MPLNTHLTVLDRPHPPPRWRRMLPRWLRGLWWVDESRSYDAFLSYSWAADRKVAPLIQSVLHRFLRPWYKTRALNIFRDLSSLPASTDLLAALHDRIDRSKHLIVLACPESATSAGMEAEAEHWLSRPRDGQVLIVVSSGTWHTWQDIRQLLPPALRKALTRPPLWVDISSRRQQILAATSDVTLRGQLTEDLKQVILCFYPHRQWAELRGEERLQRRRAFLLVSSAVILFTAATFVAVWQFYRALSEATARGDADRKLLAAESARADSAKEALDAHKVADLRKQESERNKILAATNAENALREQLNRREEHGRQLLSEGQVTSALPYLANVYSQRIANPRLGDSPALRLMLRRALAPLWGRLAILSENGIGVITAVFSPNEKSVATVDSDGVVRVWLVPTGELRYRVSPESKSEMIDVTFSPDGTRMFVYENNYRESDDSEVKGRYHLTVHLISATTGTQVMTYDERDGSEDPADTSVSLPRFSSDGKAFALDFDMDTGDAAFLLANGEPIKPRPDPTLFASSQPATSTLNEHIPLTTMCGRSGSKSWATPDGTLVVDDAGMLYRTKDCLWVTSLEGSSIVRSARFTRNNRHLLVAYDDGAVLWDLRQTRPSLHLELDLGGSEAVFSGVGTTDILIVGPSAREVRRLAVGSIHIDSVKRSGVSLIPMTNRAIVETGSSVELQDTLSGRSLATLEWPERETGSKDDGSFAKYWLADPFSRLLMVTYPPETDTIDTTTFQLRDLESGRKLSRLTTVGDEFDSLAMSWKRREIFTASRNGLNASVWIDRVAGDDNWSPRLLRQGDTFESLTASVFLNDGLTVLAASGDRTARLYGEGTHPGSIRTRLSDGTRLSLSRDGHFAALSNEQTTEILDLRSLVSLGLCPGRSSGDRWATSADSRFVVTAGPGPVARVCDLETARVVVAAELPGAPSGFARFSETGSKILVQAGPVTQVWNVGLELPSPSILSELVRRLLPFRLEGERLVPNSRKH